MRPMHKMTMVLLFCLPACTRVPEVTPQPVPPPDKLLPADCKIYGQEIARRMKVPPTPEQVQALEAECQERLADKVQRVIIRCWRDSQDVPEVRSCNVRF